MVDETTMQRLAFIKYLYGVAVEQSRQPQPLGAASVLTFHDSVELFLHLAAEHLDVDTSNASFMGYWDHLKPRLEGDSLTQKQSMRRLNRSRVDLKHHGILPAALDIEGFRASTANFFEDNMPLVFGIAFDSVSMANLIDHEEARSRLANAGELIAQGDTQAALEEIAISFDLLMRDYEARQRELFGIRSPTVLGKSVINTRSSGRLSSRGLERAFKTIGESIQSLENAVNLLILGVDYRRYVKFKRLTPSVFKPWGRNDYVLNRAGGDEAQSPPVEDARFSYDFVIETAVRLRALS